MPTPPYTGPEIRVSLDVLRRILPGLPEPIVLLGGWGVRFVVNDLWRGATGQDYFGSRDIDLGFNTPPDASLEELKRGNLPAALKHLETMGFTREGMYSLVRYYRWEDDKPVTPEEAKRLLSPDYYIITVDLIASHERRDLRKIAGFQPFSEPLLSRVFEEPAERLDKRVEGRVVWVPAPHVLLAMKLVSFPERTKDDKVLKDLCDVYAIIAYSGVPPASLGSLAASMTGDFQRLVLHARESEFIEQAAVHLGIDSRSLRNALNAIMPHGKNAVR